MATVYRIQPAGLGIAGHCSETSSGDINEGCHVFLSLRDVARAVRGGVADESQPELLIIRCHADDLEENEENEGMTLLGGKGDILARQTFRDWDELHAWASDYQD